jgi:[ribosomal protein S5]-alanine N-acetyltransferase
VPPELQTRRLLLRPLQIADAEQIQQIFPQWEIVRHLNAAVPWPYPADGAITYYRDVVLPAVQRGQEWHWTLRLKTHPEQIIGAISLTRSKDVNRGFWIDPAWQNQGLMTEAVCVVNDYWFDVLGFPVLRVWKAAANVASRRISEKTGMRVVSVEERDYVSGRFLTEVWELTAQEWRSVKQRRLVP